MAKKADTSATTFNQKKNPKVVSHLEIHPNMKGGHDVHVVHTHSYDHPNVVKEFPGPHAAVPNIPKGHIFGHLAEHMSIPTTGVAAGTEENVGAKEGAQL